MSLNKIDQELMSELPVDVFNAKLGHPTLDNDLFGTNSILWRSLCVADIASAAISGDTVEARGVLTERSADALGVLLAIEDQAGQVSSDGEVLMLPCGRMGKCAIILMMNSGIIEPINCPEHEVSF